MTTLDDLIRRRFSLRDYAPRPVGHADLVQLCDAARHAPSACNSQTWRFVVVTNPGTITRICDEAMLPVIRNDWLRRAPALIVGCSQLDIVANRIGRAVTGIEYHKIDLGIAMEHMALKAVELGLGTCWIGWFHERKLRHLLGIPRSVRVSALLSVGYPASDDASRRTTRRPLDQIAFAEQWGVPLQPNAPIGRSAPPGTSLS